MSSPPRRLSRLLRPFFSRMPLGRREEAADGQTARTDCKSSTRSPFVFETLEPRLLLAGDALGLAVAYAFDETSGTTAADATSHAIVPRSSTVRPGQQDSTATPSISTASMIT